MGIQKYLDDITGTDVQIAGTVLAWVSMPHLKPDYHILGFSIALMFAITFWITEGKLFKWLSNFADPRFWPTFVALGVAALFAAHNGGLPAVFSIGAILTIFDGIYFEQNY